MSQIVKLRRSSVSGQKPTNSNLQLGELALNTTDGKVYMAKSGSLGPSVEELISTNTINTGSVNISGSINLLGHQTITGSLTVTDGIGYIDTGLIAENSDLLLTSGSNVYVQDGGIVSASALQGDGSGIINIPASGVTGLELYKIVSGSVSASISPDRGLEINTDVTISGSLMLTPVEDPDPMGTSTTTTQLFQSSSNTALGQDLYIRQDGNLVKWKWIEGTLSSGLLYGGIVNWSGSEVYISKGSGIIVDYNATTGSEVSPMVNYVNWNDITSSLSHISSSQVSYLYIDNDGELVQQQTPFTAEQYQQYIPLGGAGHFDYENVQAFGGHTHTAYGQSDQTSTFIDAFGPLKINGYILTGQEDTLSLSVGSGTSFIHGGFYKEDQNDPSVLTSDAAVTASIVRCRLSDSETIFDNNNGSFHTTVDPTKWDNNGTLDIVNGGNWSIQRVFTYPPTNTLYVYYGQEEYTTFTNALQYLSSDPFIEGIATQTFTTFVGYLILRGGTTDITNNTENRIIQAGLYRNTVGGSTGGAASTSNLEDLVDVNVNTPLTGQALIYDAGVWVNGTPVSSSYSTTSSYVDQLNQDVTITGSLLVSGTIISNTSPLVSGSSQIEITGTTGYSTFSSSIKDSIDIVTGSITDLSSSIATTTNDLDGRVDDLETESGSIRGDFNLFTSSYTTGSFTGSFNGDGSGLTNLSNITGSIGQVAILDSDKTVTSSWFTHVNNQTFGLGTDSYTLDQPERLMVDNYNSINIATFQTSQDETYAQVNVKNFGSGSASSADFVLWNDVTTEEDNYVDLGLNSSNYTDGFLGYENDGYLYSNANDLYVGSYSTGSHGHLHLFGGGNWDSSSISIYSDNTIGINTDKGDNQASTIPSSIDGYAVEISGSVNFRNNIFLSGSVTSSLGVNTPIISNNGHNWEFLAAGQMRPAGTIMGSSYDSNQVDVQNLGPLLLKGMAYGAQVITSPDNGSTSYTWEFGTDGKLTTPGDVNINGILTAKELHIDYVTSSVLYQSGSTNFGNTSDDIHSFTGSINITGSINVGSITGSINFSNLTNVPTLVSGSSQISYTGITDTPSGIVSGSSQIVDLGFLTTGSFESYTSSVDTSINNLTILTSSYLLNTETSSMTVLSSSYAVTASYALSVLGGDGSEGRTAKMEQSVASTTWTFNHYLGERFPAITVFNSDGFVIIPTNVEAIDTNQLEVTFSSAQSGYITATVGGGLPTISGSYNGRVLAVDGSSPIWKENIVSGSLQISNLGFSTTGSNSFNGNQTITGSLTIANTKMGSLCTTSTGDTIVLDLGDFDGATIDYVVKYSSNRRFGTIMGVWDGAQYEYNEVATMDIGNTSDISFNIDANGNVHAVSTLNTWEVTLSYRALGC